MSDAPPPASDAVIAAAVAPYALCAPGDEQKPLFLLRFNDADLREMIFDNEAEARTRWGELCGPSGTWSGWLFGLLPATTAPSTPTGFVFVPREALESLTAPAVAVIRLYNKNGYAIGSIHGDELAELRALLTAAPSAPETNVALAQSAGATEEMIWAGACAIAAYGTSHFGDDRPLDQQDTLVQAMPIRLTPTDTSAMLGASKEIFLCFK